MVIRAKKLWDILLSLAQATTKNQDKKMGAKIRKRKVQKDTLYSSRLDIYLPSNSSSSNWKACQVNKAWYTLNYWYAGCGRLTGAADYRVADAKEKAVLHVRGNIAYYYLKV